MKKYDIVVIGAGPGGYVAAIKAGQLGAKVAIIEKNEIGGVCLNIGCIPTKALIKSARVYEDILRAEEFGITLDQKSVKVDLEKVVKRKDGVVKKLTAGVGMLLKKNKVDVIKGEAKVKDKNTVEVNGELIQTNNLIIATGASPVIPPIEGVKEGFEKGYILTSKEALSLNKIPTDLVVVGGGVIGIEFATIYASFGSNVTVVEMADNILVNIDDEIRASYLKSLKKQKINVITKAAVTKVDKNKVVYTKDGQNHELPAEKVLMSVGMRPNTSGFEHLGFEITRSGITTNEKLETTVKGIYAIGDVNGKQMLAHVASAEGIIAVENIMGKPAKIDYTKVPAGIYGTPEIASVGLTEQAAKEKGIDYKVSKFPLVGNGKSLAEGETDGFIKVIANKKYDEIIGVHILAPHATDLISEAVVLMELEGTAYELANAIHPHPTLSETIMEAAHGILDKPIHM
ncbi:MAG: dihydrolipoyl dehydrogenase [Bacilli bacterium]|nr:dihydrolipoyl dehydrogenase [Bacilli bacterium]